MPSIISNHDYPDNAALGEVFNLSAAISFPSSSSGTTIVATSGQVGESSAYSPFHPSGAHEEHFTGTHVAQFEIALQNTEKALSAAQPGLSTTELWEGVFNVTSFHVGVVSHEEQLAIAAVARRYFGRNRPGWSAVGVVSLFPPRALVEVQVQAAYGREEVGKM